VSGCYTREHYMSTSAVSCTSRQFTDVQYWEVCFVQVSVDTDSPFQWQSGGQTRVLRPWSLTLLTDFSLLFKNYLFRDILFSRGGTRIKKVIMRDVTPYDLLQINDVSGERGASIFRVRRRKRLIPPKRRRISTKLNVARSLYLWFVNFVRSFKNIAIFKTIAQTRFKSRVNSVCVCVCVCLCLCVCGNRLFV
jgi:hypothetical protein